MWVRHAFHADCLTLSHNYVHTQINMTPLTLCRLQKWWMRKLRNITVYVRQKEAEKLVCVLKNKLPCSPKIINAIMGKTFFSSFFFRIGGNSFPKQIVVKREFCLCQSPTILVPAVFVCHPQMFISSSKPQAVHFCCRRLQDKPIRHKTKLEVDFIPAYRLLLLNRQI